MQAFDLHRRDPVPKLYRPFSRRAMSIFSQPPDIQTDENGQHCLDSKLATGHRKQWVGTFCHCELHFFGGVHWASARPSSCFKFFQKNYPVDGRLAFIRAVTLREKIKQIFTALLRLFVET